MSNDGFCYVTRKKWLSRRTIQKRQRRNSDQSVESVTDKFDFDQFSMRIKNICEDMRTSEYFINAINVYDDAMNTINLDKRPERMVCFGLGSFTRHYQALHQLAFIICLQRHFCLDHVTYYDPILRDCEKTLLKRFQGIILKENCEAKHVANVPTIYYMPHVPNCLTNNLLWCNWRLEHLTNVLLINNSFDSLITNKPDRFLKLDSNYILNIQPHVKEFEFDNDYEIKNVFNDLSLHLFPAWKLPLATDTDFWAEEPAPDYPKEVEMVFSKEFNNLNIS